MTEQIDFHPKKNHAWVDLEWLLMSSDSAIVDHFVGSPLRRAGPIRLKRNASVVMANIGDHNAQQSLKHAAMHKNNVREHAKWALQILGV